MESKYIEMIQKIKDYDFIGEKGDLFNIPSWVHSEKKFEGSEAQKESVTLSIIIPTYKRPQLLKQTLDSITSQKGFDDYEIVILDNSGEANDGKISETERVVLEADNARILYYQNEKEYVGNWNLCLTMARGEWVCMVHDDDVLLPDCLSTFWSVLNKYPQIEFLGGKNYNFQDLHELNNITVKHGNITPRRIGYEEFMYGMPVSLLGSFFKKDKALELGGFDLTSYMADYVFVAKYSFYYNTYFYHYPGYGYRISNVQDSANNEMNYVRRVADYYLWRSIAQRRKGKLQKLYLKNCQYNLRNRIFGYNADKNYGKNHHIDLREIFADCGIDETKLFWWEEYICKAVHFVNMVVAQLRSLK